MTDKTPQANKNPEKDRARIGKNNKRKGGNGERLIVKRFKQIGFEKASTTRLASKLLDGCGVDVTFIPTLPQVKVGMQKAMKPEIELQYIKDRILELLPEDAKEQTMTKAVIHIRPAKGPRRTEFDDIVSMTLDDYMKLVSLAYPVKKD